MTQQTLENTPDRKDLKVQALLERISQIIAQYENQDAERRIDITMLSEQLQNAQEELAAKDTTDVEETPKKPRKSSSV